MGQPASLGPQALRSRLRSVRRQIRPWHRLARRQGEEATSALRQASQRLIAGAQQTVAPAGHVGAVWQAEATPRAQQLVRPFEPCRPRVARVLAQTIGRIVHGDVVPARDTRGSLCEPHTQMIVRRKTGQPVEFGRQGWLEAVEGGLISGARLLAEAGQDFPSLPDSLAAHQQRFGKPPWLWAADRGVSSAAHEAVAHQARINRGVIPYAGKPPPARVAQERTAWFRRGWRCRAGLEGRIRVLRRRGGLDRWRDHGEAGLGRWVGWGIVTANRVQMAHTLVGRLAPPVAQAA